MSATESPGTALITGANRGLGLAHARLYLERGWRVIACARHPEGSDELRALADEAGERLRLEALEVTDHAAIDALAVKLAGVPIDVLWNNAGTFGPAGAPEGMAYQSVADMDYEIWRDILEVNLLAPFHVATAFAPALRLARRPVLAMMSSDLGSITNNTQGQSYAYRSSKAGLNIITRGLAAEWPDIIVVAVAPGWCRTGLGGDAAPLDPADSARAQQATIDALELSMSGRFIDRHGDEVPW